MRRKQSRVVRFCEATISSLRRAWVSKINTRCEQQLNENVSRGQAYRNLTGSRQATSNFRADILRKRKAKGNCYVIMTVYLYVFSEENTSNLVNLSRYYNHKINWQISESNLHELAVRVYCYLELVCPHSRQPGWKTSDKIEFSTSSWQTFF